MITFAWGVPAYRSTVDVGLLYQAFCMGALSSGALRHEVQFTGLVHVDTCDVAHARNLLVYQAMERKCDWLLMTDADTFAADPQRGSIATLASVIMANKADIAAVGALVPMRNRGGYNALLSDSDGYRPFSPEEISEIFGQGQIKYCDRLGTAYLVINCKWLAAHCEAPWFKTDYGSDNGRPTKSGEDYHFSDKVRALGGRLMIDGRLIVRHTGADGTTHT